MKVRVLQLNQWSTPITALCDTGSDANLILKSIIRKFKLPVQRVQVPLTGARQVALKDITGCVQLELKSNYSNQTMKALFYIVDKITRKLPSQEVATKYNEFRNLELADPEYGQPKEIQALFGVNIWIKILTDGVIKTCDQRAAAQQTKFGWIIYQSNEDKIQELRRNTLHITDSNGAGENNELHKLLTKFWEIEALPTVKNLSPEQQRCEQIFSDTHTRDSEGRYIVHLPFNSTISTLGKSKYIAKKQFLAMEQRMHKNKELHLQYSNFIREFEALGHLTEIENDIEEGYYMPHHAVFNAGKIRVVFNASCKTNSGTSPNDCQLVGAKLQRDLAILLLIFCCYEVALTADVIKMYRQVKVHLSHRKFQNILWRYNKNEKIKVYRINRVTYGQAAAPHLAIRAMHQCAYDHMNEFPIGAHAVLNNFFVDDTLTGADSTPEAITLKTELTDVLAKGKFELAKWNSNKEIFSEADDSEVLEINEPETRSILGLRWIPKTDSWTFKPEIVNESQWTKRKVLSQIGRIYDPNGPQSPITIIAKIIIQKLWKMVCDWDDPIDEPVLGQWTSFLINLMNITKISIPRWMGLKAIWKSELHGFCDASESAYAAVVYIRTTRADGEITVRLAQSKTKVAPLKTVTIPRLELCGALILAKMSEIVLSELDKYAMKCHLWTDSQIVLHWLEKPSSELKTFVANRVANIQHKTIERGHKWHWVRGDENPADLATRGATPDQLCHNTLWWNGPHWLMESEHCWPCPEPVPSELINDALTETKLVHHILLPHIRVERGPWFRARANANTVSPN